MLRVAYDISKVTRHPARQRYGISRSIEEILRALGRMPDVQVSVHAICDVDNRLEAMVRAADWLALRELSPRLATDAIFSGDNAFRGVARRSAQLWAAFGRVETVLERANQRFGSWIADRTYRRLLRPYLQWQSRSMPHADLSACDVFHSTFNALPPRSLTRSTPRVMTVYDLIPINAPQYVTAGYASEFLRTIHSVDVDVDRIIVISSFVKDEVCEYLRLDPARVHVVPLAAASSFRSRRPDEATRSSTAAGGPPYLVGVASSEPRKNLKRLIRVFETLLDGSPLTRDLRLVLVGLSGGDSNECVRYVRSNSKLAERVSFVGHVSDSALAALFGGALAFVFPSLYEGFGLPVLEAMQAGAPVISSRTTSIPEVAGDAAVLVDPENDDEIRAAICRVVADEGLRRKLSSEGLVRAQSFTWQRSAELTRAVYQTCAGGAA